MPDFSIKGLQAAQAANKKLIAAVQPTGGLGRAIQFVTTGAHRYAVTVTHVLTGALRAAHRMERRGPAEMAVYVDPSAVNPRGGRPGVYGPIEERRGGSHAFYYRTTYGEGPALAQRAMSYMIREMP